MPREFGPVEEKWFKAPPTEAKEIKKSKQAEWAAAQEFAPEEWKRTQEMFKGGETGAERMQRQMTQLEQNWSRDKKAVVNLLEGHLSPELVSKLNSSLEENKDEIITATVGNLKPEEDLENSFKRKVLESVNGWLVEKRTSGELS